MHVYMLLINFSSRVLKTKRTCVCICTVHMYCIMCLFEFLSFIHNKENIYKKIIYTDTYTITYNNNYDNHLQLLQSVLYRNNTMAVIDPPGPLGESLPL